MCAQEPAKRERERDHEKYLLTHLKWLNICNVRSVKELTNVGVEELLVTSLTLLQLQLHLDVLPTCHQNHILVVGLLQCGQGLP